MKRRIAAEWEPALGTMVSWPPALPAALLRDLANDHHLWVLVADEQSESEARAAFSEWGTGPDSVTFVRVPQGSDAPWVRDWGPQPLFDEDTNLWALGPRYVYSTPFAGPEPDAPLMTPFGQPLTHGDFDGVENRAQAHVAKGLGLPYLDLPCAFTGGNVLSDGNDTLMMMDLLLRENEFDGTSREAFHRLVTATTGMSNHVVLPNYEDHGLQHVDCYLKLLDEERILVLRPPADHPLAGRYEAIVDDQLRHLRTPFGRPYQILRLDTAVSPNGGLAAYINAIIVNTTVYVPLYGIDQDTVALAQWRDALPGYTVRGYEYVLEDEPHSSANHDIYTTIGWADSDVLHCRTRAVWDPAMVHLSVRRIDSEVDTETVPRVSARIVDYAGTGVSEAHVYYRVADTTDDWARVPMLATCSHEHYDAALPAQPAGTVVEYYVKVVTNGGTSEFAPRSAPQGVHRYRVTPAGTDTALPTAADQRPPIAVGASV